MGALVHKQRLARRHAVHVDLVFLQLVGERLFDVEQHAVEPRMLKEKTIEDVVDVARIQNRTIKIASQPFDSTFQPNAPDFYQALIIPCRVIAPQFYLEAF